MDDKFTIRAAPTSNSGRVSIPSVLEKAVVSVKDLDETYNTYKQQDARDPRLTGGFPGTEKNRQTPPATAHGHIPAAVSRQNEHQFRKRFRVEGGHESAGTAVFVADIPLLHRIPGSAARGRLRSTETPTWKIHWRHRSRQVWGLLTITTPACKNFAGIAANRFLLGVFESVVNPGFVLCLSMWYRADEQPLRMVSYYCMNGVAGIFGGLLGYAVGHITTGLPQWQYVFLIFGSISLTWGGIFTAFMPDLPTTARFLNDRQRIVAVERVAQNRQGVKNHHFKMYQMWQCLRDPKTWILFFMSIAAQIPNAAQSTFTSIILKTFGFDVLQTQYMQIPGNVIQVVSLLASGYVSSRFPNMRCAVMLAGNLVCVAAGGALVGLPVSPNGTDNRWGRLVALWLCSFQSVGFSMSLTMVSSNVAGYTKKQLTGAILFVGYCIIGPQTFIEKEAPFYTSACILIGYSVKTLLVVVLYIYMWAVNKKRDREAAVSSSGLDAEQEKEAIEKGMQDVTELDNPGFRYVL
ncbi:hypothetical protein RRF57_003319 [Xylaria bambusicola]|uniref:Major facilitator superfamily (MFS) profile domain-containing protein n=1 Tax=Xylaria bambusicola TaxID=326684 RepID=A0AAN7UU40_9PEZI